MNGSPRSQAARIVFAAALSGAGTMVIELSAVRLLAPWFGASTSVWTNVIGVVLLALALGYALGGRLARRTDPRLTLRRMLALGALLCAGLPFVAPSLCRVFMPSGVALHDAFRLMTWGSLASALLLFLPAAVCLGAVAPLATEALQQSGIAHAGAAGGRVLAWSTIGSLIGTFATVHLLIPELGLRWTFATASALLALAALSLGVRRAPSAAAALFAAALLDVGSVRAAEQALDAHGDAPGTHTLARAESAYQAIRVVEDRRGDEPLRLLQVNEGLDSFQSVWVERLGAIGEGYYYDAFALPAWWARASGGWRVLVLGLGAGTTFRVLEGASPAGLELELTGVEIDPRVVDLGRTWFGLASDDAAHHIISAADARSVLAATSQSFELLVLDAYAHQVEIPAHLASREFFELARAHLVERGWLAINVGAFGTDDPLVSAIGATAASAFESEVLALRIPSARNVVIFARRGAPIVAPGDREWLVGGPLDRELLAKTTLAGAWRKVRADEGSVLTDDRNCIDLLQAQSLEQARERLEARR